MKSKLTIVLLLLLAGSFPARAQFLGYTSPQTVLQKAILNNVSSPALSAAVQSIGQSAHYVIYRTTGTITSLSLQIEGSMDCTNYVRITDVATANPSGALFASGFFPCIRLNLSAISGGGSLTADYAGTSVTPGEPGGIFRLAASQPLSVSGASAGTNATYTITLPSTATANTTIYLAFSGSLPSGATVSVTAGPTASAQSPVVTNVPVASSTAVQTIPVGSQPGGVLVVTYTSAPSTGTYTATVVTPPAPRTGAPRVLSGGGIRTLVSIQ